MKKLALILALMLIPCSAFGLEMLTNNALDNVTGQAGVAIAADDIQIFLHRGLTLLSHGETFGNGLYHNGQQLHALIKNMIEIVGRDTTEAAASDTETPAP